MKFRLLGTIALAFAAAASSSCGADKVTGLSERDGATQDPALLGLFGPRLIQCPSSQTYSVTDTVGVLGGLLSVAGTSVSIPAGALLGPTEITLTIPASPYMEIDVSVAGVDHFLFQEPITMSIGYSRCNSLAAMLLPLTAWYIDSHTNALIDPMPSVDNKLTRTVTFTTIHLSGYALAN